MLEKHLNRHNLTPQQFSKVSGMPLPEVKGLLEGRLSFTILRAYHLAAVFNTQPEIWLNRQGNTTKKANPVFTE